MDLADLSTGAAIKARSPFVFATRALVLDRTYSFWTLMPRFSLASASNSDYVGIARGSMPDESNWSIDGISTFCSGIFLSILTRLHGIFLPGTGGLLLTVLGTCFEISSSSELSSELRSVSIITFRMAAWACALLFVNSPSDSSLLRSAGAMLALDLLAIAIRCNVELLSTKDLVYGFEEKTVFLRDELLIRIN